MNESQVIPKKIGIFTLAFTYVGTIIGAGFASGREIWQFFGVFGLDGFKGILVFLLIFSIVSIMATLISRHLRTSDMGKIIAPEFLLSPRSSKVGTTKFVKFVGYFMAGILFLAIVSMSAASGALVKQEFNIPPYIGGIGLVVLVFLTLIGGFDRVKNILGKSVPVLIIIMIVVSFFIIFKDRGNTDEIGLLEIENMVNGQDGKLIGEPSPLANGWMWSSIIYMGYNILAIIPIVGSGAYRAKSSKTAVAGGILGSVIIGCLVYISCLAMSKNPEVANQFDMPMLALSSKIGKISHFLYVGVMLFAIYSSTTGMFYGFTTKLNDKNKNLKIGVFATIGFILGLVGFKFIVAYVFPLLGYIGFLVLIAISINFIRLVIVNKFTMQERRKNRYSSWMKDTKPAYGGESILVIGSEKAAIIDCGMPYQGEKLIEKIKGKLGVRKLDYVFLTHSHYDHVGGLSAVRREWENVKVFGTSHCKEVIESEKVRQKITDLSYEVLKKDTDLSMDSKIRSMEKFKKEDFYVDEILSDGDVVSLGDVKVRTLVTKGHTRCSASFGVERNGEKVLVASESIGVLDRKGKCQPSILHSFEEGLKSIEICREYGADRVVIPHYGLVPKNYNKRLFALLKKEVLVEREEIMEMALEEKPFEDIVSHMAEKYWDRERRIEQPFNAFLLNMQGTIKTYMKDAKEYKENGLYDGKKFK